MLSRDRHALVRRIADGASIDSAECVEPAVLKTTWTSAGVS